MPKGIGPGKPRIGGRDGPKMSRERRQFLTFELARDIDNIRSLTPEKRMDVMRRGREVFESTLSRLEEDAETLRWFTEVPTDFRHIHRHDFTTRMEAVMTRGPPQNTRELGKEQRARTMEQVGKWKAATEALDSKLKGVLDNLRAMGLFYQLRNP